MARALTRSSPAPAGAHPVPPPIGTWSRVRRAFWVSRLLAWGAGLAGAVLIARPSGWRGFDPDGLTDPFGLLGDALAGPLARWDSAWYLRIATEGYAPDPARAAFFPLYPLLVRLLGAPFAALGAGRGVYLLAGVAISLAAFAAGLWLVHRLAALELGERAAGLTVALLAVFPTAFFFSAVYTESLFLALSAGSLYAARRGRWGCAGGLGALASATRSTGLLLVVPLVLLALYGPREDRAGVTAGRGLRPPYGPGRELAWLALVPAGALAFAGCLAAAVGDPLRPLRVGRFWYREAVGPLAGLWDGGQAAVAGLRQLLSGGRDPVYFAEAAGDPLFVAAHNVGNLVFLVAASLALIAAVRRLPPAYSAWAACSLLVPLSMPVGPEPLASLPRYLAVVFPLPMAVAAWALEREGGRTPVLLGLGAAGMATLSAWFAAWWWVA